VNLTERAELVLDIARRIHAEKAAGRSVDPSRLEWADAIVKGNRPPEPRPQMLRAVAEQRS
jgi:hypothetical protein